MTAPEGLLPAGIFKISQALRRWCTPIYGQITEISIVSSTVDTVMDECDKNILYFLVQKGCFKNVRNKLNIIENFVWKTI